MSESERATVKICKKCGVRKVSTDPWGRTNCFACGEAWAAEDRTEGHDPGGSEALGDSRDESKDLVSEESYEEGTVELPDAR